MTTTTTQETQDIAGHIFSLTAAFSLGVGITELVSHLREDYHLLSDWRWANVSYFGARWCGLMTMAGYIVLASIGHVASYAQCHGVFIFSHVFCTLNSIFSASIFWTRCGALCDWNRRIMIPLAIYGMGISGFALASSLDDFAFKPDVISSSVCIISMKSTGQAISRFLFASFDLMVAAVTFYALWYKSSAESWISKMLLRDQLIYITVTMTAYLGLASSFFISSLTAASFGLLCPSFISVVSCRLFLRLKRKGKDNHRNDNSFHKMNAFDQRGIQSLFKSKSKTSSHMPSRSQELNAERDDTEKDLPLHNSSLQGSPRTATSDVSSSFVQLIYRRDDEAQFRRASLSDSPSSQHCRVRMGENRPAKERAAFFSSSRSSNAVITSTPRDLDLERCQEVLQGDQRGFPRRISPRPSPAPL